ncbi:MAG: hypothetical protein ACTHN5_15415 [Phycisphaerae bacterium]
MTAVPLPSAPPASHPVPAAASPLTPEQVLQFQHAQTRGKKVRRAVAVAMTDGYFTAIGAATTILFGLFDPSALVLGVALAVLSVNAFRGARRLKRFDLSAPRLLAINQLLLAAVLVLYCFYAFWAFSRGNSDLAKELSDPQLANLGVDMKSLTWNIMLALYGGLAFSSIVAQGLTALYYFTRKRVLADYLAQTPAWVVTLQKAQAGA